MIVNHHNPFMKYNRNSDRIIIVPVLYTHKNPKNFKFKNSVN